MPHKFYHGRTGQVCNVTKRAIGVEVNKQFDYLGDHGTRIVIYNLWEDDEGKLELDFETDKKDIQIRGVNRDESKIKMAETYPNSRHFLTYHHSLRSYAAILYLRMPSNFKMVLRGEVVDHHNIVDDMMYVQEQVYKPAQLTDGKHKNNQNVSAAVTIGFVKDAKSHIDVQGFNVYHKNRLIKPFWRVWNASGSGGRGVIGVLEANFVEPAHDKQGFEHTLLLSRLEARLVQYQKTYWQSNCHFVGYVKRVNDASSEKVPTPKSASGSKRPSAALNKDKPIPVVASSGINNTNALRVQPLRVYRAGVFGDSVEQLNEKAVPSETTCRPETTSPASYGQTQRRRLFPTHGFRTTIFSFLRQVRSAPALFLPTKDTTNISHFEG